jgi:serine/threonine protein kinase
VQDRPISFGPYELLKALGRGSFGDVHLARPIRPELGLPPFVVVKRLRSEHASNARFARRFAHEAAIATSIDNPHVVRVYDSGQVDGVLYIAMEHISGWPLDQIIEDHFAASKMISLATIIEIGVQCLAGLTALHEATDPTGNSLLIVHRDLAPKNILLGEDGRACLIDLGLGKSRLRDWKTATGMLIGTPGYMAPEQVRGKPADHRSDLYALGVVLFELITLESYIPMAAPGPLLRASLAPQFRPPSSSRPDVPKELDELVRRALEHDPADRFQSAREIAVALERIRPASSRVEPMRSLVGEMRWQELTRAQTEIEALGATSIVEHPAHSLERTVIFARRGQPPTMPLAQPSDYRSRGSLAILALAGAVLLFSGALVGVAFERHRSGGGAEVMNATPVGAPRPAEGDEERGPQIVARATKSEEPQEEPREEPSQREAKAASPSHAHRKAARTAVEAPPSTPPAPATQIEGTAAYVKRLAARALRLRKQAPGDERIESLLAELNEIAATRRDDAEILARARKLEPRLVELEHSLR